MHPHFQSKVIRLKFWHEKIKIMNLAKSIASANRLLEPALHSDSAAFCLFPVTFG
jgi:hypothetical protein